jgi:hypothetical protein
VPIEKADCYGRNDLFSMAINFYDDLSFSMTIEIPVVRSAMGTFSVKD